MKNTFLYSRILGYAGHIVQMWTSIRPKGMGRMNPHRGKYHKSNVYEGNVEKRRLEKHRKRMKNGCA